MNEDRSVTLDDIEESDVPEDKSVLDKIEEATGGMHKGAPLAGDQQEGNFENIERGRDAESGGIFN